MTKGGLLEIEDNMMSVELPIIKKLHVVLRRDTASEISRKNNGRLLCRVPAANYG